MVSKLNNIGKKYNNNGKLTLNNLPFHSNQPTNKRKMDNKAIISLVDSALSGDRQAIELAIRKLASKVRETNKDLYCDLSKRVSSNALRSTNVIKRPAPVDIDTRLNLTRIEDPVLLEETPIYSNSVKSLLQQVIVERRHAEALRKEMVSPVKSLIFDGPPGVGKTMSARWLASQLGLPLLTLDLATVMSSFLGKTGSNLRSVLDYASSYPCVLLMDEFDAVAKRRDDDRELGELKRLVTVLLQAIDDWPDSSVLIAATNHGELLDPAVWRRFDMEIQFTLPDGDMINDFIKEYWPEFLKKWKTPERVFEGKSFSYIDREMRRLKRENIIMSLPIPSHIEFDDPERYQDMSVSEKKLIAKKLFSEGKSQRSIADLIKISRQTVKKAIEE